MGLSPEMEARLVEAARAARSQAYAPYSGFAVGAAVLGESGRIYVGCNVENAAYGATLCAERVAVGQAVVCGERKILAACVVGPGPYVVTPCGSCRQVLAEFGPEMVILADNGNNRQSFLLSELLPHPFDRSHLASR